MSNPQHLLNGSYTVKELAEKLAVPFTGCGDTVLTDLQALGAAKKGHLSFLDNPKYIDQAVFTHASAVIITADLAKKLPKGTCAIISDSPYVTYAKALNLFYPNVSKPAVISEKAFVGAGSEIAENCRIEPFAYVGENVVIGEGCTIASGAHIGDSVVIGARGKIGANVSLICAEVGNDVTIHAGACIGQDGFGFAVDTTVRPPEVVKVNQIGMVRIGDRVEIGANTTIDRGSLSDTIIGDDTKIDNLVQIGHNVKMGAMCQIVSQTGIAGSTTLGNGVVSGGQAGFVGHIDVADGVMIAARSVVTKSIAERGTYSGFPAIPMQQWRRLQVAISKLGSKKK